MEVQSASSATYYQAKFTWVDNRVVIIHIRQIRGCKIDSHWCTSSDVVASRISYFWSTRRMVEREFLIRGAPECHPSTQVKCCQCFPSQTWNVFHGARLLVCLATMVFSLGVLPFISTMVYAYLPELQRKWPRRRYLPRIFCEEFNKTEPEQQESVNSENIELWYINAGKC